ncbi:DUF4158 domain-containing protein [Serratia sp. 121840015-1]
MTTCSQATVKNERFAVLNSAEQEALYALPDFDDAQRLEILAFNESELALACSCRALHAKMYYIIQIAYFKVKHLFFRFGWDEVPDDCSFVLSHYFLEVLLPDKIPTKQGSYAQREKSARCMVNAGGHLRCLYTLSNRSTTLFTAMSLSPLLFGSTCIKHPLRLKNH